MAYGQEVMDCVTKVVEDFIRTDEKPQELTVKTHFIPASKTSVQASLFPRQMAVAIYRQCLAKDDIEETAASER